MLDTQSLRIKMGKERTRLTATHKGEDLTFLYPKYGPDTYANVKEQIERDNIIVPTFSELTSLAYTAFNSGDKYSNEIKHLMKKMGLWGFTGILYVPKGAYIKDRPEIRDSMLHMEESDLERRLEAKDPSVRFVPFGYQIREMKPSDLARNKFVQALADGEEGAEKLAEIADKHSKSSHVFSFKSVNQPETRVAALGSYWDFCHGLVVDGDVHGFGRFGCALGVQKTSEANRAKKIKNFYIEETT